MALTNYRKIDITQQDGKRKIIDTFINAIYVFDDHLKIVYNGNNKEETVSLEALENSSTLFSSGAPKYPDPYWGSGYFNVGRTRTHLNATVRGSVARDGSTERNNYFCPQGKNANRVRLPAPQIGDPRQRVADFTFSLFTLH